MTNRLNPVYSRADEMAKLPYLGQSVKPMGEYPQFRERMPYECFDCSFQGPGTEYCSEFQRSELERQAQMLNKGNEPRTTEQFFLDCPKALQERLEETRKRNRQKLW